MPPPQGNKYVLVMICMFSHWVEAFPCRRATALMVGKLLLEKIIPIKEFPLSYIEGMADSRTATGIRTEPRD